MNDARRQNEVMVRLNDTELARLDGARPPGIARAVHLRNLLREPSTGKGIADRREILALLSEQARAGKVAAAIALERALRAEDEPDIDDELERILGGE
jgi:hypothetical protein